MRTQPTAVILVATSATLSATAILVPTEVAVVLAVAAALVAAPVAVQRSGVAVPVAQAIMIAAIGFQRLRRLLRRLYRRLFNRERRGGPYTIAISSGAKMVLGDNSAVHAAFGESPDDWPARKFMALVAAIEQDGAVTRERVQQTLDQATRWFKYLQRQNDQLSDWNRELHGKIDQMRGDALAAEKRARRSSTVSFWAGVAISIPVGILINLATG